MFLLLNTHSSVLTLKAICRHLGGHCWWKPKGAQPDNPKTAKSLNALFVCVCDCTYHYNTHTNDIYVQHTYQTFYRFPTQSSCLVCVQSEFCICICTHLLLTCCNVRWKQPLDRHRLACLPLSCPRVLTKARFAGGAAKITNPYVP